MFTRKFINRPVSKYRYIPLYKSIKKSIINPHTNIINIDTILIDSGAIINQDKLANLILEAPNYDKDVTKYIKSNSNYFKSNLGPSLIFYASRNYWDIVKLLIKFGADVQYDNNNTIIYAAHYGNINMVKFLLENGSDINANNDLALIRSMCTGELDYVKEMIKLGSNVDNIQKQHFDMLLMKGYHNIYRYLKSLQNK